MAEERREPCRRAAGMSLARPALACRLALPWVSTPSSRGFGKPGGAGEVLGRLEAAGQDG